MPGVGRNSRGGYCYVLSAAMPTIVKRPANASNTSTTIGIVCATHSSTPKDLCKSSSTTVL